MYCDILIEYLPHLFTDASEPVVRREDARPDSRDERAGEEPKQIESRKLSGN